jgi:hypothetical protein
MSTLFVPTTFKQRLEAWDREDQKHVYALQLAIESMGWDALLSYPFCQIETVHTDQSGDIRQMDFWVKIRRDYVPLTLELRMPGIFVLHD